MNEQDQFTDLDNPDSDNGFGLEFMLGAFFDNKIKPAIEASKPARPLHPTPYGTKTTDGSSPFIIPVESPSSNGPAAGRMWKIRTVGIYGNVDAHTAITGTAEFFAGDIAAAGGAAYPPKAVAVDNIGPNSGNPGVTIPFFFTLPDNTIWCKHGETVYALVYGVASGTQLTIIVNAEDWDQFDVEPTGV